MDLSVLKQSSLFYGIAQSEIQAMLGCLSAESVRYGRGECIYRERDVIRRIGIVQSGRIHMQQQDYWGNRSIISEVLPGGLFGERYTPAWAPSWR